MYSVLYDTLALLSVVAAVLVITVSSPVVSVLCLIASFGFAAAYLMVLGVGFVGLSYLIVYVGAIAVLFLFVVMMLNVRVDEVTSLGSEYTRGLPLALLIASMYVAEVVSVLPASSTPLALTGLNLANAGLLSTGLASASVPVGSVGSYGSVGAPDVLLSDTGQVQALGMALYHYEAICLMVISVVLLLAMVGAIVLCLRSRSPQPL